MSHQTGQTASKLDTHSDELHLVVLTQQNKRLLHEKLPFKIAQYQHQDELNFKDSETIQISLFCSRATASPLFTGQSFTSLTDCFSFISNRNLPSSTHKSLISVFCDPLTKSYFSLIYDFLNKPLSDTLFEFFHRSFDRIRTL